ncbi:bifunctional diaminohydroxyphosphoribosylaminopyrimidine deaminase/5-amino-6-(5-phosphoribosylamino)uracil reductase RibD [Alteromonas pelagimontana]|uniref:Riboflavin biosynthesis protein RibD n=1 Tax=Alteromonas pelagimontana TaxID=1858656 RepID=A0A6M4MG07_9ALTE|nr:bifunctional diaminohydroxyphosphoribosylaminopyrimidine deaminase/5-amino-6-(5-phosphoribosylamino)uracil reductase RibD [Alteromonas pelagimontana]QJR82111.1 bifunctional diaminohydroxyphosphoribosylaminopyrimidine deaminase/5-amino-6-(5-phosphoribosylamino)uracil reductase RibD [Alteromonas pelagimontana]
MKTSEIPQNTNAVQTDYLWMAEAIKLARKGHYTTSPNPAVGCVIIDSNGNKCGTGFHLRAGTPHAEVHALQEAGASAKGATAYVTLEPCSHFGRTPPCAEALIKAGVKRVVVAMTDPNPRVSGRGIEKLQAAGIEVTSGILAAEAATLNRGFIKRMVTGKPFVTVKVAASIDGKIALANGVSQWITGPEARQDVQRHRAASCAVLTGSGTAKADNPSLLVRPGQAALDHYPLAEIRQPLRIVVDSNLSLPPDLRLFHDGFPTIVATCIHDSARLSDLVLPRKNRHIDVNALMQALGERQLNEVWVEAGPGLSGALFQAGEVDELIVYQAPKLLGSEGKSMLALPAFTSLDETFQMQLLDSRQLGNDIKMTYRVR